MTSDLTPQSEKPIWPLSSYGAAKHEPTLLKDLDGSPEELRVRAAAASQAGHINEYVNHVKLLLPLLETQVKLYRSPTKATRSLLLNKYTAYDSVIIRLLRDMT